MLQPKQLHHPLLLGADLRKVPLRWFAAAGTTARTAVACIAEWHTGEARPAPTRGAAQHTHKAMALRAAEHQLNATPTEIRLDGHPAQLDQRPTGEPIAVGAWGHKAAHLRTSQALTVLCTGSAMGLHLGARGWWATADAPLCGGGGVAAQRRPTSSSQHISADSLQRG